MSFRTVVPVFCHFVDETPVSVAYIGEQHVGVAVFGFNPGVPTECKFLGQSVHVVFGILLPLDGILDGVQLNFLSSHLSLGRVITIEVNVGVLSGMVYR